MRLNDGGFLDKGQQNLTECSYKVTGYTFNSGSQYACNSVLSSIIVLCSQPA